jgi:hypothetical protein
MTQIKFDPRLFISPPYIICPKCGKEMFGILTIGPRHYSRRCKECLYPSRGDPPENFDLPELQKKVIYIDQCAISEMMKALNPKTKAHQKGAVDDFWIGLFERLDSLCKLQLVICPDSLYHMNESLVSPYYEPLKRMYEQLSNGVSFYDKETIGRFQFHDHAKNWISGTPEKKIELDVGRIVYGNINAWQDTLIISVKQDYGIDWIEQLRKDREKVSEWLVEIFKRWQSEKDKTFDDRFNEECMGYGITVLRSYIEYAQIVTGQAKLTTNYSFPTNSIILIHLIRDIFRESGIAECDILPKIFEYFTSPCIKEVPFLKISSMLFAALARKAAAGRKKPPNRGMSNDIAIISSLLPYCDAMFIDNECHSYLQEQPLCKAINYETAIFSQNNKEEFMTFLNNLESIASAEHLDKVKDVYGTDWKKPYVTLYKEENLE